MSWTGHGEYVPDVYVPVCERCRGDGYVYVWSGRTNDRQPCPDCVMRGVAR